MNILTHRSRTISTAHAFSNVDVSSAASFSQLSEAASQRADDTSIGGGKNASSPPQFSATQRFRVLMAMEPAFENANEDNAREFFENPLPDLGSRAGAASLNHHWEKLGFAINFIAIVTALAYVIFT